ncbi:MAG: hypothetical protein V4555_04325 [Acidobacteriota bacterium]
MTITELTPPIFAFGFSRVDSAAQNAMLPYRGDGNFFRDHPKRRVYVRNAWADEFDKHIPAEHRKELPTLHVLVTQVAPGVHYVAPVFRTSYPFWANLTTDAEVASVVAEMCRRGGMDVEEMAAYAVKHCTNVPSEFSKPPKLSIVH